jgi:adenylosuccinate lyase
MNNITNPKFQMLDIEILACEAWHQKGKVPSKALKNIKRKAKFNIKRIDKIEEKTRHDLIAFLTCVAENVGPDSKYIHMGLTSYDIEDTALSIKMREASDIILKDLNEVKKELAKLAKRYKKTPMMGRTHGVHAEPITFGLKMALWYDEIKRNIKRMQNARENINYGKLSGAVGTNALCPLFIEKYVCKKAGLKPAPVSTQVLQRDRHAEYLCALAIIAGTADKFAREIRNLQRTEIREVEESFAKGQKGSSAMPHKRNPIVCERISSLARVVRANTQTALENIALWHERDLTNSACERVILPDSAILIDYMLNKLLTVLKNLKVYKDNMMKNLNLTGGLIFSQTILLALVDKGITREEAYALVQTPAMQVWEKGAQFKELILNSEAIRKHLSIKEIKKCFDLKTHLKNIDKIFKKAGL